MAKAKQYIFSYQEVAEALVKQSGLREGLWGIYVKFGIQAANLGSPGTQLVPAAVIPILNLGLQRFEEENSLTVDASKVNPPKKQPRKKTSATKRSKVKK